MSLSRHRVDFSRVDTVVSGFPIESRLPAGLFRIDGSVVDSSGYGRSLRPSATPVSGKAVPDEMAQRVRYRLSSAVCALPGDSGNLRDTSIRHQYGSAAAMLSGDDRPGQWTTSTRGDRVFEPWSGSRDTCRSGSADRSAHMHLQTIKYKVAGKENQ